LKKNYTKNPLILLPIKYHESNLNILEELQREKQFLKLSNKLKSEIIECSEIVRDIDIISNMKFIINNNSNEEVNSVNYKLVEILEDGGLGDKDLIKNKYDEIVYILCGISIISDRYSIKYIKKHNIVGKLIKKLYIYSKNESINNVSKKIEDMIYERYHL
jgi:hypothetical protein